MSHLAVPLILLCACMTWLLADCATASSLCRVCSGQEQRSDSRISCTSIIFFAFVLYSIISNPFLLMSILILTGALIFSWKSHAVNSATPKAWPIAAARLESLPFSVLSQCTGHIIPAF